MGAQDAISLVYQTTLATRPGSPLELEGPERDRQLEIAVVFTSVMPTIRALKEAGLLAMQLNARINLIVAQVVPWPLQLTSPPVLLEFDEGRFRVIASRTGVHTDVSVYLCRARVRAITNVLRYGSLVMIGGRSRWWPTVEKRLAWKLRRAGHQVVFTEMEDRNNN